MEDSRIASHITQWEMRGYKRKPGRRKTGWTSSDEIFITWKLSWKKPKNWRQTEQDGGNVWSNAAIRMKVELVAKRFGGFC